MAKAVYVLCMLTSLMVAILLLRAYTRTGARILLWSALGFIGLCLNNVMLVLDTMVVQHVNLGPYRNIPALIGMGLMLFGLIWKSD